MDYAKIKSIHVNFQREALLSIFVFFCAVAQPLQVYFLRLSNTPNYACTSRTVYINKSKANVSTRMLEKSMPAQPKPRNFASFCQFLCFFVLWRNLCKYTF